MVVLRMIDTEFHRAAVIEAFDILRCQFKPQKMHRRRFIAGFALKILIGNGVHPLVIPNLQPERLLDTQ